MTKAAQKAKRKARTDSARKTAKGGADGRLNGTVHARTRARGRPSIYTEAVAAKVCELIASGKSLRRIANRKGMPALSTMLKWLQSRDDFTILYAKAREARADMRAEEIVDIADSANERNERSRRLQVDARKWAASKENPKRYGDRLEVSADVHDSRAPTDNNGFLELARSVAYIMYQGRDAIPPEQRLRLSATVIPDAEIVGETPEVVLTQEQLEQLTEEERAAVYAAADADGARKAEQDVAAELRARARPERLQSYNPRASLTASYRGPGSKWQR